MKLFNVRVNTCVNTSASESNGPGTSDTVAQDQVCESVVYQVNGTVVFLEFPSSSCEERKIRNIKFRGLNCCHTEW
jgi:hypothetical protein